MKYFLPKPYLSYSAISCFMQSREEFRKRYYENRPMFITPELTFGKKIGEMLENDDESLRHILRYDTAEQKLEFDVDGISILGYIDTFDSERKKVGEYKTGKVPWTQGRVNKHLQLDIYSLGVETVFGNVDDECVLVWLETEKVMKPANGRSTHSNAYEIQFTGKVKEFTRVITKEDRENAYNTIIRVAQDISEDYTDWMSEKEKTQRGGRIISNSMRGRKGS